MKQTALTRIQRWSDFNPCSCLSFLKSVKKKQGEDASSARLKFYRRWINHNFKNINCYQKRNSTLSFRKALAKRNLFGINH